MAFLNWTIEDGKQIEWRAMQDSVPWFQPSKVGFLPVLLFSWKRFDEVFVTTESIMSFICGHEKRAETMVLLISKKFLGRGQRRDDIQHVMIPPARKTR